MKIAICGKGGVGKTSILAVLARHFQKRGKQVLLIDADPSPHMAQTIGVEDVDAIVPIADMKELLKERSGKQEGSPFYNINPQVDDLLARFMVEKDGLRLMVLGAIQTAESGCACAENTVLKRMLTKLMLRKDDIVLLDMEAGVEHLGRGTVAGVDHLLVVVIPSQSGVRTALKIRKLAGECRIPRISFVGNQVLDDRDRDFLTRELGEAPIACFPDSPLLRRSERQGVPLVSIADEFAEPANQVIDFLLGA
ncbi:MAG: AAA family ATPase [Thermodesulfobacteriota bacterium]